MDPYEPYLPEPPRDWARILRQSRYRRRRPVGRWAAGVLVLVAVGAVMFQVGQAVAPARPAVARPTAPPAVVLPDAGHSADGTATTHAPAPATTTPPRPRVLTLVTRNIRTEADPNRVYLVPGQVTAAQAAAGKRPRFVVRPGEALRVRVDNQDRYIHSFTFATARVNLDAWEGTVSAATFRAPKAAGTYQFYCRYRKVGMSGILVVRGSPVSYR
jgi:hypothetical protein